MKTPICDFVNTYARSDSIRLHMPGHKGISGKESSLPFLAEAFDITEIPGADSLYEADGIIRESEKNASSIFGSHTFYSTEGSSQCIRAMLYLSLIYAKSQGKTTTIAAARNVHKSFISAAAMLDIDINWIYSENTSNDNSYLSCKVDADALDKKLSSLKEKPFAFYITSPDYLGNISDVSAISRVCHKHGVLLLVDNAHGAYLKFLSPSQHPIDLGADLCCDSAHKTLPVLTGGAYLHISQNLPSLFADQAKGAMALFGSTSPSYLTLCSLDGVNPYLSGKYKDELARFVSDVSALKLAFSSYGYVLAGNEPLKICILPKSFGYTGIEFANILAKSGIMCEFSDLDHTVMMLSPSIDKKTLADIENTLLNIGRLPAISDVPPGLPSVEKVLSVRDATLSPREQLEIELCLGRVLAEANIGCPPAIPILVCGERINEAAIECFKYYGISHCFVVC